MTDFSVEARVVSGVYWHGSMFLEELSFERPWIIHPRLRRGLDELVEAGLLTIEKSNEVPGKLVWRPTDRMKSEGPKASLALIKANGFLVTIEEQADE